MCGFFRWEMGMRWMIPLILPLVVVAQAVAEEAPWGTRVGDLQSRMMVAGPVVKGGAVGVTVQVRNVSDKPLVLLNLRVWVMVAQGAEHVVYSAPFEGEKKKELGAGEQMEVRLDAGSLAAYRYVPTLILRNGLPVPPPSSDKSTPAVPPPTSVGTISEVIPVGMVKVKAFVIAKVPSELSERELVSVIPSASVVLSVEEKDISKMSAADQRATFEEIATLFCADAVAGKSGHDRAVRIGKPIIPRLVELLSDERVTEAGRMWLTAAIIDLRDEHTVAALESILNKGGNGAYVVAYMGPKLHDPALTAAISSVAGSTKDAALAAWAARGLGLAGEPIAPKMLEAMVAHSDASGRAEAADILAADTDPHAPPFLAKLIGDADVAVRLHAAKAAADHNVSATVVLKALEAMAQRSDSPSRAAAKDALNRMTTK
jgi:hypothetical protein